MKEWKTLKDFYFNQNKFCSIIISLIFFIFSSQVYGESVKDIICVGPTGDTASESGTNPCNLHASGIERDVNVVTHTTQLAIVVSSTTNAPEDNGTGSQSVQ